MCGSEDQTNSQIHTSAGMNDQDRSNQRALVVRCNSASEAAALIGKLANLSGARVVDLFAAVEDGTVTLRLIYALDKTDEYHVIEWPVIGFQYPALSDIDPATFVEECEIYEQFGIRPEGGKPLNRVVVPPHVEENFPRLGSAPIREARQVRAPHFVAGEAFEFPFGPVRAVGQESLYVGLVTSGEEVIDLYLMQWHKHRGIERRVQGMGPERALFFVERAEGLSAVGNSWAFCRAVEQSAGIEVHPDIERIRGIALELERLYNHAASIAALGQATGLSVGQAQAEIALENQLRLNAVAFGHRYLFGVLAIGGVYRSPNESAIRKLLPEAHNEFQRVIGALTSTNSFLDRLEAAGTVLPEVGRRLAVVGPVARASGYDIDTRRDHPFGPYRERPTVVAARNAGDVLARMEVMVSEAEESVRLIDEFLSAGVQPGTIDLPDQNKPIADGFGWCESPRGESVAWVSFNSDGTLRRLRLRPASVRNWRVFDDAARSRNVFTDVPIIEASFWLTVAGFSR